MRLATERAFAVLGVTLVGLLVAVFLILGSGTRPRAVEPPRLSVLLHDKPVALAVAPLTTAPVQPSGRYGVRRGLKRDFARMAKVRGEIKFAWDSYKQQAWGHDILRPLASLDGRPRGDKWIGAGLGIIDALDTL